MFSDPRVPRSRCDTLLIANDSCKVRCVIEHGFVNIQNNRRPERRLNLRIVEVLSLFQRRGPGRIRFGRSQRSRSAFVHSSSRSFIFRARQRIERAVEIRMARLRAAGYEKYKRTIADVVDSQHRAMVARAYLEVKARSFHLPI